LTRRTGGLALRAYTRLPFLEAFGWEFAMARCEFLIEHQGRSELPWSGACSGRSRDESGLAQPNARMVSIACDTVGRYRPVQRLIATSRPSAGVRGIVALVGEGTAKGPQVAPESGAHHWP
jgi:hypothetical protein